MNGRTDWYVVKYGTLIESIDIVRDKFIVTTKLYLYEGKYYIETWQDDYRLLFYELLT